MENLELKDIAQKYGVPMPETCKELGVEFYDKSDYEDLLDTPKTHFYWIKTKKDKCFRLCTSFTTEQHFAGYYPNKNIIECFAAPQMHEIVPILPKDNQTIIRLVENLDNDNFVHFGKYDTDKDIWVTLKNHHYAQAYAELYLELKSKGLL